MTEQEKMMAIYELIPYALGNPMFKYFDLDSNKMLDDKIEVLEALKAGKPVAEIPKFYDVLELLPKEGMWD